jgi:hypothetical protein
MSLLGQEPVVDTTGGFYTERSIANAGLAAGITNASEQAAAVAANAAQNATILAGLSGTALNPIAAPKTPTKSNPMGM